MNRASQESGERRESEREAVAVFNPLRRRLFGVAYRMLGSVADAEDVMQEAFLRRIVTRLCLDYMKTARHRRETYLGPWLPDPIMAAPQDELEDVTLPLMMALERLSPLERAVFLLHDVFGVDFEEIAEAIGRKPVACRQLASRARSHVRAARPRFDMPKEHGLEIASAFFAASRNGDLQHLRTLLAADVVAYADGGGKVSATPQPIVGIEAVIERHAAMALVFAETGSRLLRYGFINGLPGFLTVEPGDLLQTTALEIADGKIVAIYVMRNPDKLRHLSSPSLH